MIQTHEFLDRRRILAGTVLGLVGLLALGAVAEEFPKASGYQGIWYANQPTNNAYVYKYSGGLGTYCAKHIPMAVYAPEVERTFFVYGGTKPGKPALLEMCAYYDHRTAQVPAPTILLDKKTDDAHDNPVISIDDSGHIWVFASSHGTARPSFIFRSEKPYEVDAFETVLETNFSYPQPWYLPGKGFLFLHTYYKGGRGLYWMTSKDGRTWSERKSLAHMAEGHYMVSWPHEGKVGAAFNYHPKELGLNHRTNLYYLESADFGESWWTASGEQVDTPLGDPTSPALVHGYESEGLKVYMKDLNYDAEGHPLILHLTSKSWQPGPEFGPHLFRVARWTGAEWEIHPVAQADNNYDMGSLYVAPDGVWRVIAPSTTGPDDYNPGGEIVVHVSKDQGATWAVEAQLTANSTYNHTYVRRPLNADPGFLAFWADGDARKPSESRLYFYDARQKEVRRLPQEMTATTQTPELVGTE